MTGSASGAGVLMYRGEVFVYTQNRAVTGVWFQVAPSILSGTVANELLGRSVQVALASSRSIPAPTDDWATSTTSSPRRQLDLPIVLLG